MKLPFCVACLATEDLQHHHLVTRKEGGKDNGTNLITLCADCHNKLHERQMEGTYNHSKAVRTGQAQAKTKGVKFGPKFKLSVYQKHEALDRLRAGESQTSIAKTYNVDRATISRLQQRAPLGHV